MIPQFSSPNTRLGSCPSPGIAYGTHQLRRLSGSAKKQILGAHNIFVLSGFFATAESLKNFLENPPIPTNDWPFVKELCGVFEKDILSHSTNSADILFLYRLFVPKIGTKNFRKELQKIQEDEAQSRGVALLSTIGLLNSKMQVLILCGMVVLAFDQLRRLADAFFDPVVDKEARSLILGLDGKPNALLNIRDALSHGQYRVQNSNVVVTIKDHGQVVFGPQELSSRRLAEINRLIVWRYWTVVLINVLGTSVGYMKLYARQANLGKD